MRFNPDDILLLAELNPGYGFKSFIKKMTKSHSYESSVGNQILRIFEIHKNETGIDFYHYLQDTTSHQKVSLPEYLKITGKKSPPSGFGGSGGRLSKLDRKGLRNRNVKILLPPQIFNWSEINPQGSNDITDGTGSTNHWKLIDIKKFISNYEVEMKTIEQIMEEMNLSRNWIIDLIKRIETYDQEGILQEWIDVVHSMYVIRMHRGKGHFDDELMADFRGIFRDYINDPISNEAPSVDDIFWVYNMLLSEEE